MDLVKDAGFDMHENQRTLVVVDAHNRRHLEALKQEVKPSCSHPVRTQDDERVVSVLEDETRRAVNEGVLEDGLQLVEGLEKVGDDVIGRAHV